MLIEPEVSRGVYLLPVLVQAEGGHAREFEQGAAGCRVGMSVKLGGAVFIKARCKSIGGSRICQQRRVLLLRHFDLRLRFVREQGVVTAMERIYSDGYRSLDMRQ